MNSNNSPLIIAGMHRSGTSLTANWLAQCGLDMGDELVPADFSNPTGHYEDRSFLNLHRSILQDNGTDHFVTSSKSLAISPERRAQAMRLIETRHTGQAWGWKDPRTTLFLDFWHSLLPDMKVLILYRHYTQVVDSLLRRELNLQRRVYWKDKTRVQKISTRYNHSFYNVPRVRTYLHVWYRYNQDAISFARTHSDSVLLLHVSDVITYAPAIIEYINREWGLGLLYIAPHEIYDSNFLHTDPMPIRSYYASQICPDCKHLYKSLQNMSEASVRLLST